MKALGIHVLVELFDCDAKILNNYKAIQDIMVESAKHAKVTVVETVFHKFNPHGVSGVVVIAESHISIHTWPEYGYAALDFFTCGNTADPYKAYEYVAKELKAKKTTCLELKRGVLNIPHLVHKPNADKKK